MCDERMASRLTAISSAKRNGLKGKHIVYAAQLQQHWTYGLGAREYTHQAKLTLPKWDDTQDELLLPTPKLTDLLNPMTPAEEEAVFNNSDPYDVSSMFDPVEEDEDIPKIICSGTRLDIDELIDLANQKLNDRYDGRNVEGPEAGKEAPTEKICSGDWVEEKYTMLDLF